MALWRLSANLKLIKRIRDGDGCYFRFPSYFQLAVALEMVDLVRGMIKIFMLWTSGVLLNVLAIPTSTPQSKLPALASLKRYLSPEESFQFTFQCNHEKTLLAHWLKMQ